MAAINLDDASESRAWPFLEAKKVLDRINYQIPNKGYVLFETGYGPSGLPHIGTFAEVVRTTMVMNAFKQISDIPAKLLCFSDDMDGLRKVPSNIPNQEMVSQYIDRPLTSIPDPFGKKGSYGTYMNAKLCSFLDYFNFDYEFGSATEYYKSGGFDQILLKALAKYEEIMSIMLPTLRSERQATYSPFLPICPRSGRVLQVPVVEKKLASGTIIYRDPENEKLVEVPVTRGHCKLQWKPDFGMRWAALGVDYEMYGKDHLSNGPIYSSICRLLGGVEPVQLFYELFLGEQGDKISKSKGNGISVEEWLSYAPVESMALFMYQSLTRAKRLYFDVIPRCVDDYLELNRQYNIESELTKKLSNPAYHIHASQVPVVEVYGLSFSLLLNLVSVCNAEEKHLLWSFISRYSPLATPTTAPYLDKLVEHAIRYYHEFVKPNKKYIVPNNQQIRILNQIVSYLGQLPDELDSGEMQKNIYQFGVQEGYENLRDYFQELYRLLLGQDSGPRLGSLLALLGKTEAIKLVKRPLQFI